jgi:RNA-directed DNA polymerase
VAHFLSERGLELSHEKTNITHIQDGFDFLGENVRRYPNGKVLLRPSRENIRAFLAKIKATLRRSGSRGNVGLLVQRLNQQIQGWARGLRDFGLRRVLRFVSTSAQPAILPWRRS